MIFFAKRWLLAVLCLGLVSGAQATNTLTTLVPSASEAEKESFVTEGGRRSVCEIEVVKNSAGNLLLPLVLIARDPGGDTATIRVLNIQTGEREEVKLTVSQDDKFKKDFVARTVAYKELIKSIKKGEKGIGINEAFIAKIGNPYASLGTKIRCGTVGLTDTLAFIISILDGLISVVGTTLAVIMIILAGYQYMFGGLSGDEGRGKKTIINVVIGVVGMLFSWQIVDWIQWFITTVS